MTLLIHINLSRSSFILSFCFLLLRVSSKFLHKFKSFWRLNAEQWRHRVWLYVHVCFWVPITMYKLSMNGRVWFAIFSFERLWELTLGPSEIETQIHALFVHSYECTRCKILCIKQNSNNNRLRMRISFSIQPHCRYHPGDVSTYRTKNYFYICQFWHLNKCTKQKNYN